MPVVKSGNKWEFGGKEYDTEEEANKAYQASIALKFGVKEADKKAPPKGKKKVDTKKIKKTEKKVKTKRKVVKDVGDHEFRD